MVRRIILVDQSTGRKYLVELNPPAQCPNCPAPAEGQKNFLFGYGLRFREQFAPERKQFRLVCARCGSVVLETQAQELER